MITGSSARITLYGNTSSVKWYSSSRVLKVKKISDNEAELYAAKYGRATVNAKIGRKVYRCRVTIKNNPQLSQTSVQLEKGSTFDLSVSGTSSAPRWSTSNKKVAAIKKINARTYRITAAGAGNATITAKVNGKKLRCSVTVTEKAASAGQTASAAGGKYVVTCNYHYSNAANVLGYYQTVNDAVRAINAQNALTRGEWFVCKTGTKEVVWPDLSTNANKIQKAIAWAAPVSYDTRHGYSCVGELTGTNTDLKWGRWGAQGDYSCSTIIAMAYELTGYCNFRAIALQNRLTIPVKKKSTVGYSSRDLPDVLSKSGKFMNISAEYKSKGNAILKPGDVLVNKSKRHCLMYIGGGSIVEATTNEKKREYATPKPGDQKGSEIRIGKCASTWEYVYRPVS